MACKVEQLKLSATNFGFDAGWVADVLEKYGPEVLAWAIELARNGLSVTFIVEVVQQFGPVLLQLLVDWLNKKNMAKAAFAAEGVVVNGDVIEGVDASFIDLIVEKYLPLIIQKYLPMIMEKYGPQLIQMLVDMFLKSLQK
jgi:hypothetical protein